jgi:hypothetical protein
MDINSSRKNARMERASVFQAIERLNPIHASRKTPMIMHPSVMQYSCREIAAS